MAFSALSAISSRFSWSAAFRRLISSACFSRHWRIGSVSSSVAGSVLENSGAGRMERGWGAATVLAYGEAPYGVDESALNTGFGAGEDWD